MQSKTLQYLKDIVDIDTSKIRNIKSCFQKLHTICVEEGLYFNQYSNKILLISNQEINLKQPYNAILTHIDVVGVNKNSWVVEPFNLNINERILTGRGVIDNKSSVISCLLALKNVTNKTILPWVLIVGSLEEVSMADIGELFTKVPQPQISFTPDGLFDVCISEPHIITCDLILKNTNNDNFKSASKYYNVVCGNLSHNKEEYIGKAAHVSDIKASKNALYFVPNIANEELKALILEVKNHQIPTIAPNYFSTFNIGFVNSTKDEIKLGVDIRIDGKLNIDREYKTLKTYLSTKFNASLNVAKVYLPGYSHEKNELFQTYAKNKRVYDAKGGTYARKLKNCFVIGPQNTPDSLNGPHSDNEQMLKKDYLNLMKRYENVILELDAVRANKGRK